MTSLNMHVLQRLKFKDLLLTMGDGLVTLTVLGIFLAPSYVEPTAPQSMNTLAQSLVGSGVMVLIMSLTIFGQRLKLQKKSILG